jgi:sterol desaturase/sphingolipid hydroxylase (fatty acid hydroxylase superfamily)
VHHVLFNYNYGQYTMLWDHIFGSFMAYNEESPKKKAALGKAQ